MTMTTADNAGTASGSTAGNPAAGLEAPGLRLVRPAAAVCAAPVLSADQQRVVDLPSGSGPALILGAPGTGKSTVLVESAVARIERDGLETSSVLILAPTRLAAARLRDQFTGRLNRSLSTTPARTWSSYAFDLLRRAKVEGRLALERAPKLLSGPEQDHIITELLRGHDAGFGSTIRWPDDLQAALPTRGFRQELRQLFDRVIEYGLTAPDLALLGQEHGRPDWTAAAQLFQEYRDLIDIRMPEAFDPAGIITAVRQLFQEQPDFLAEERQRLGLILVDDIQEANPAIYELLAVLGEGKDTLVTACPDTVVQGFRGARPDLVPQAARLLAPVGGETRRMVLTTSHRLRPAMAAAWGRVAGRIAQTGEAHRIRQLDCAGGSGTGLAEAHIVPSAVHELRYVAQRILAAQLRDGRRLSDIAVIVRTGAKLAELQRYLSGQGIPVSVPVAENAVRDEVAVRPLLDAFAVAMDSKELTPDLAVGLLTSRIGGATAIDLRRLRQSLRREEALGGGGRGSDSLLVEALTEPGALETLGWEAKAARRIARMLADGRRAAAEAGANAESVLWVLWEAAGLADHWARVAMEGGPAGVRADRDLDAIMALFHTAERFVDQLPGSTPQQFLDYLLNQDLPMDTLAQRAQVADAVELLTPASAAGRAWPVVIVAGLQDGVWPNTRLRGELLGSTELVDVLEMGSTEARRVSAVSRLRDIRYDELRSFSTAVSRAGEHLLCVGVSSEDDQPSSFLDLVDPWEDDEQPRPLTEVVRPLTLRALTAELRQAAQTAQTDPEEAAAAARQLAVLAANPVPVRGADPSEWWGLLPLSSTDCIVAPGQPVPVSPSKVEAVHKSPLDWFIQAAGGEAATDFARSLGTLVHSIAQDLPDASGTEYVEELTRRWPSLGMKDNWEGRLDFRRAERMVRQLAEYVILMRRAGRSLLATEQDFEVSVPGADRTALLRGQVDRLEIDAEGRLVIVDLKTGKSKPTAKDMPQHPQLAAYQTAVREGGFDEVRPGTESGGAALVQLGVDAVKVPIQEQEPLAPDDTWARDQVLDAAALMAGNSFLARHDPGRNSGSGHGCRVPEVCPLCAEGKQVTE